jgi:hypothetical protein
MGILAGHLGDWRGTNAFRLTPTDPPHEAAATAQVTSAVRGLLTEVAYTWSHPEAGEQTGLLVLAAADDPPGTVALWSDTFHQAPAAGWLTGSSGSGTVTLGYGYAGDWRWEVVIDASDPGRLRIRMDNVVPESAAAQGYPPGTYWAMQAELSRQDTGSGSGQDLT